MDLTPFKIDKEYIQKVHNNCQYNKVILNYYKKLSNEIVDNNKKKKMSFFKDESYRTIQSNCDRIDKCNKFWLIDRYDYSQIKDFKKTNLCKDKFCNNCKKVKQASRMSRYIPELEKYSDNLYHITLTIPNVNGNDLDSTLKHMSESYRTLMRIFRGNYKLSFVNFDELGYQGCVRSLEITFDGDNYHPHYHCGFVFENLSLDKIYKNNYSIDYKKNRSDRLFSQFEIELQKLWYMIYNDIPLTKKNFDKVELGYSCNCDKFRDSDYAELFKYMTKETNESNNILTYENFKVLYYSTKRLKQIQGYGCLYRITDKDLDEEVEKIYQDIHTLLVLEEMPKEEYSTPISLLNDTHYTVISRKKIFQYLRDLD